MPLIADTGLSEECYEAAWQAWGEKALAEAMMHIVAIPALNRMQLATAMRHE